MTLAPVHMASDKMKAVARAIAAHQEEKGYELPIIHVNITFGEIVSAYQDVLDDRIMRCWISWRIISSIVIMIG